MDIALLIKKHRGGRKGTVVFRFEREYVRMKEAVPYKPLMPKYEQKTLEAAKEEGDSNGETA